MLSEKGGQPVRVGWPDTLSPVAINQPERLLDSLNDAIVSFQKLRPEKPTVIDAKTNSHHKTVILRVKQVAVSDYSSKGIVEPEFQPALEQLQAVARAEGAQASYWGGNSYFCLTVPLADTTHLRESILKIDALPWDEQYRVQLEQLSWDRLRKQVFRNGRLANRFATMANKRKWARVLVPSVGLSVHPWIFANRNCEVVANDLSTTAIETIANPGRHPKIFSSHAFDRWDISMTCDYGNVPHPEKFEGMPDLCDGELQQRLGKKIRFDVGDWKSIAALNDQFDFIFASNALPRKSESERLAVLQEWVRVLKPDGSLFIAQHNPGLKWGVADILRSFNLRETALTSNETDDQARLAGFQLYFGSG